MLVKSLVMISVVLVLSGCATRITMTGKAYPPVNPIDVKILFKEKPKCNFEEMGFISTPLANNQNAAVELAREKAAEVGADYITIETIFINHFNDASVSAIAYKCGTVDRHQVNVTP